MTLWLPEALKQRIRALPQWSPIALHQPQDAVQIRMCSAHSDVDVTRAVVVAALRPLTFAMGLTEQTWPASGDLSEARLQFLDLESGREVGTLDLQHVRNWESSGARIGLFCVRRGAQRCVRWPYRPWNRWLQNRKMRKNIDPHNFHMPPEAVQQQMIFYICPRPVVLVSVADGSHSNLFPMDLIGPVSTEHFTLALRSTSQSIPTMKSARKVALTDVAARDYAIAYKLGAHHKNMTVAWDQLPFGIRRSRNFSLPYPESALRIREAEILDFDTIGSHTFFLTRIVSEEGTEAGPQFFHTSGIYQHFRTRNGRPFPRPS
jgi:flavin reductase (DIM6/NTAB) family NADH-FMN oxidoreductase RutF